MDWSDYPDLFTYQRVADFLDCNVQTVKNKITSGKIQAGKFAGLPRVTKDEVKRIYEEGVMNATR